VAPCDGTAWDRLARHHRVDDGDNHHGRPSYIEPPSSLLQWQWEVPRSPPLPLRPAAMWAGVAVLSLAIAPVAALPPVDSRTVAITHSGTMTVTAITALQAIMDVYRWMLMAMRSEGGRSGTGKIMMRNLPSIVPSNPQRAARTYRRRDCPVLMLRGHREARTVVEEE
jgi:hypothetical protein